MLFSYIPILMGNKKWILENNIGDLIVRQEKWTITNSAKD